ncbi:MAG: hypothetical protein ACHQ1D_01405 [Nitrososphaerales archaeon]
MEDVVPISVSFNLAVEKCIAEFGNFDGIMYVDSGCLFENKDILSKLYATHIFNNNGITACLPDTDTGAKQWFDLGEFLGDESKTEELFHEGIYYKIPLSKTTNLHAQIFSTKWLNEFGQVLPDLFAGHCMESIFSYMCAAIKQDFVLTRIRVGHAAALDGGSSGFSPQGWENETGRPRWDHPFVVSSVVERLKENGYYGGYEECFHIIDHDPTKFDENGYAKDNILLEALNKNAFLTKEEFDYAQIRGKFIA